MNKLSSTTSWVVSFPVTVTYEYLESLGTILADGPGLGQREVVGLLSVAKQRLGARKTQRTEVANET